MSLRAEAPRRRTCGSLLKAEVELHGARGPTWKVDAPGQRVEDRASAGLWGGLLVLDAIERRRQRAGKSAPAASPEQKAE